MRRILTLVLFLVIAALAYMAWLVLGPATAFSQKTKSLYIHTDKTDRASVMEALNSRAYIAHPWVFSWLADHMGVWENVRPGRYELAHGSNLLHLLQALKDGHQTPIRLVLTKVRTKQELASVLGNFFECDSADAMRYMESRDSTGALGLDTNTVMTAVIPNTYQIYWNSTVSQLMHRFYQESEKFWTPSRKAAAAAHGLTTAQVYILASIVEEETHMDSDKPLIASVYLNRLSKGMRLGADPTVKFAMGDFGLKRIYEKYTKFASPYNTYLHEGLPPGPICTPAIKTIDAVLQAPKTDYMYFVAKADFSGNSVFAVDYQTHLRNAKAYQDALDSLEKTRQQGAAGQDSAK
jgi:UPF0755 protein